MLRRPEKHYGQCTRAFVDMAKEKSNLAMSRKELGASADSQLSNKTSTYIPCYVDSRRWGGPMITPKEYADRLRTDRLRVGYTASPKRRKPYKPRPKNLRRSERNK